MRPEESVHRGASDVSREDPGIGSLYPEMEHLSYGAYTRVNIGLRLSVRLDLNQLQVTGGDGTKQSPYQFAYTGSAGAVTQ